MRRKTGMTLSRTLAALCAEPGPRGLAVSASWAAIAHDMLTPFVLLHLARACEGEPIRGTRYKHGWPFASHRNEVAGEFEAR